MNESHTPQLLVYIYKNDLFTSHTFASTDNVWDSLFFVIDSKSLMNKNIWCD